MARFECIVQCDPYPSVRWSRNGVPIQNGSKYNIVFRNGVCRLAIQQAYSGMIFRSIFKCNIYLAKKKIQKSDNGVFLLQLMLDNTRARDLIIWARYRRQRNWLFPATNGVSANKEKLLYS